MVTNLVVELLHSFSIVSLNNDVYRIEAYKANYDKYRIQVFDFLYKTTVPLALSDLDVLSANLPIAPQHAAIPLRQGSPPLHPVNIVQQHIALPH